MTINKYEQTLLQSCSCLDAVTNSNGEITSCAKQIIRQDSDAAIRLCRYIEKIGRAHV